MLPAPQFASLIVSRPCSRARLNQRWRGLAFAAALYAAGLACLLVAPLLVIEMLQPPKADSVVVDFHTPLPRGDNQPSGAVRNGVRNGSEHPARSRNEHPTEVRREAQPVSNPIAPPESEVPQSVPDSPGTDDDGNGPLKGEPGGPGTRSAGPPSDCFDCIGTGPGASEGIEDIYYPDKTGLIPPQLIPSTRALPKYPDLPRRVGVQGTVILLIVVEKDGSVGQIEVVRSSDQRWGFDLAAIDAVKQWRYRPALLGERPVAAYITVMVEFSLSR